MPTLSQRPRLQLAFLCLLYVAQGLPFGFVTVALAAHLAAGGADAAAIGGVIAMAVLPWSFKWAWGPVVDSGRLAAAGHRRPWIMLAQLMMIATAAALGHVPGDAIATLGWVVLAHNVFVGLQDVAVDALAVDLLTGADRERASGLMYGASYLGTFLGGAGLGLVIARSGLPTAVAIMVAAQMAILAVVVALRERPGDSWLPGLARSGTVEHTSTIPPATAPLGLLPMARTLGRAMLEPSARRAAVAAFALKVLPAMLTVCAMVHLIEKLRWPQERYAAVTGGAGVLVGLAASVAGGMAAARIGPRATASIASLLLGIAWCGFGIAARLWDRTDVVTAFVVIETSLLAMTAVSLFAIFMRVASPAVAATQFTASMAIMNLATSCGSWLAGPVSEFVDAPTAFIAAGLVQPLLGLLLPRDLRPGQG